MKLAIPVRLDVSVSDQDTKRMYDRFQNQSIELEGNVKGVISEDPMEQMIKNVKDYINSFWFVKNGELKMEQFRLAYSIEEVEDGNVFATRNFVRYIDL